MINEKGNNNPGGLNSWDTLEDTFKRADKLAPPDGRSHSGKMFSNKDLRRIVLLVREYRKLEAHYKPRVELILQANKAANKVIEEEVNLKTKALMRVEELEEEIRRLKNEA